MPDVSYDHLPMLLTSGKHPGTKLKGMPIAITKSATNFELSMKTGPRILVEKYMTGISYITFRDLPGEIPQTC